MFRKTTAVLLSAMLIWAGLASQVVAAVIPADQALAVESHATRVADVQAQLAREDVQLAMVKLGVDPIDAQSRVDSLSDTELAQLQGQLDSLPAGSSALAVIGVVFLVLLILELVGVTNVFSKV
jgi:hypothetical protein